MFTNPAVPAGLRFEKGSSVGLLKAPERLIFKLRGPTLSLSFKKSVSFYN